MAPVINRESVKPVQMTNEQVQELKSAFSLFDSDGNGVLDRNEFSRFIISVGMFDPTQHWFLRRIFDVCDADKNGSVDFDEFSGLVASLAAVGEGRDPDIAQALATQLYDIDGDGVIGIGDLASIARSTLSPQDAANTTEEQIREIFADILGDKDSLTPTEAATFLFG